MSGKLVVGLNPHGEITSLVFPGRVSLHNEDLYLCIDNAFSKAKASAEMIQEIVEDDLEMRKSLRKPDGFSKCLKSDVKYSKYKIKQRVKAMNDMPVNSEEIQNGVMEIDIKSDTEENKEIDVNSKEKLNQEIDEINTEMEIDQDKMFKKELEESDNDLKELT